MAGLSAAGLGSGLDITSLVSQLVAAERAPQQTTIDTQRSKITTQVSALGALKSTLSSLRDALATLKSGTAFNARTAVSSDTTTFTASATSASSAGRYAIEVVQLAQAGTLSISVGSATLDLEIDSGSNTLAGIRDAINGASNNPGVTASIVNGSGGAQLVLSAKQSGLANAFSVSASGGDGGLDTFVAGLTEANPARDAIVRIDSVEVSAASNKISTAIDGVTLNLAKAQPGQTLSLEVGVDRAAISGSLNGFVTAYNNYVTLRSQLTAYDASTGKKGALLGDATLRSIDASLSRTLQATGYGAGSNPLGTLSELGVRVQVDGKLSLDATALGSALDSGTDRVAALFSGSNGVATALSTQLQSWLDSGGTFDSRNESLDQRARQLDDSQARLDARMVSVQARYQAQFSKLDSLLSSLNNTSTFLTQQLAALNNTKSS
ncbi:MAG TPA: flagellar filament capping protein FliD [Dokdonella sp.]|nr:flagellar filament capping protein FliD [Dokdonella sp.]